MQNELKKQSKINTSIKKIENSLKKNENKIKRLF